MYISPGSVCNVFVVVVVVDRCSLPKSKMSVVIVKTGVSVRMMRNELSILSRWFSYLGQCSRKCLLVSSLLQRQRGVPWSTVVKHGYIRRGKMFRNYLPT